MRLLKTFLNLITLWQPAFCKQTTFSRVRDHALASICSIGRHTITNLIIWLGRDKSDHTADYRLYNEYKWNVEDLFNPLMVKMIPFCPEEAIVVAVDDTRCRKTGKKIPGTAWGRDPISPPFQTNLMWGQRFLQFSFLLPLYNNSSVGPRSVPVRFIHAPPLAKPSHRATDEEKAIYKQKCKTSNLSTLFVDEAKKIRSHLNQENCNKKLLIVGDASFCNKTCMNIDIPNVEMLVRTRKNTKLCFRDTTPSRKIYDSIKFTPEQVRQNDDIPWTTSCLFYGGEWRQIRFKEIKNALWQSGTKTKPLKLIVVAPLPYVKGGKRYYRQPGYLLSTDLQASTEFLLQSYLDRWQIEVNFREEKTTLGVGEAQVWNEKACVRQPGFRVAAYSALLLASILAYKDLPPDDKNIPKWRSKPRRNTCRALIGLMRSEMFGNIAEILDLGLTKPIITSIFGNAA